MIFRGLAGRRLAGLLCLLCITMPGAAWAQATANFTDEMTAILATDPVRAERLANAEIVRARARPAAQMDGRLAAAHWVAAQAQFRQGDAEQARASLTAATHYIPNSATGRRLRAQVALLRGLLARNNGEFGAALRYYRQAQTGFITAHDVRGQGLALQALGVLYADTADSVNALRYLNLAQDVYRGDPLFRVSLNNNYGVALQLDDHYAESALRFAVTRDLADELGMAAQAFQSRLNLARSYLETSNLVAARRTLRELQARQGGASNVQALQLDQLRAGLAWREGRVADAEQYLDRALTGIAAVADPIAQRRVYGDAYRFYRSQGQTARALEKLEQVRDLEEQEAQQVATNRASLMAAQFEFDAQNARIDRLNAQQLARDVANQRLVTILIVAGSAVLLALLGALYVMAIRSRNRARQDGAELAVVNGKLEGALAAKTEFLASTSHELRTPLNGILGMTQILLADNGLAERTRGQVELVHNAGTAMRTLVDDILDVAKMEHGGFSITTRPTDLGALAAKVVGLFDEQARAAGIAISVDNAVPDAGLLMVDPDRMTQILFNLVGNALKFTHQGYTKVLLAQSMQDDGARLILTVEDSGIGIAPEWQGAIFDMFRQVDGTRSRTYGGTGLGLAICRQLAQAMGGDIRLDSEVGRGSAFIIDIPWPDSAPMLGAGAAIGTGRNVNANAAAGAADIAIIASDPLRGAMLSTILRRDGRQPVLLTTPDAVAEALAATHRADGAALSLWVIDGHAPAPLAAACAPLASGPHPYVVVGTAAESADFPALLLANARWAAFTRNAIIGAVGPIDAKEVEKKRIPLLHDTANGSIQPDRADNIHNRVAAVSRN